MEMPDRSDTLSPMQPMHVQSLDELRRVRGAKAGDVRTVDYKGRRLTMVAVLDDHLGLVWEERRE